VRQAVILAGGKGSRLSERLGGMPKPLVDICGVPLLERQVGLLRRYGFREVLLLVNHGAEHINRFCSSKGNWGLQVDCIDDGEPLGTAGATLAAYERLADEFLVVYGDTMLEVDLARFHVRHMRDQGAAATLLVHPNDHPQDSDLVEVDAEDRIIAFHPYPHDAARYYPNLVNAALYWVSKEALAPWRDERRMLDFGKDLFPAMLGRGMTLRAYASPEYIKDVGTPSRLDKVCTDLRSGKIERSSLAHPQPIVFIDRDGTINREVDHLREVGQFELLPGVEPAIRRLNESDYRTCVVSNQPVIARGECTEEGLRQIHNKMETLLGGSGAYVDRIYYCPHHPQRGFPGERRELKIDCDCRKPKTGLIERAAREFNMARERSWLIGDSSVDIATARRAGLKALLVETGYAGLDYREWVTPDATVPDLGAAVSFILDQYPRLLSDCLTFAGRIGAGAIVLIGGQARSGKSTFAAALRDALRAQGKGAVILSVDRWLRSEVQRGPGVLGRYDMAALQAMVDLFADVAQRPSVVSLPGYHKLKREQVEAVETVPCGPSDVVIFEGTVALALRTNAGVETHRFHVEIDEEVRKRRIVNEYRLRGLGEAGALEIYQTRRSDEVPAIEAMARRSERVSLPATTS
jgi:histidinol-phosphate phosphatase family protein